MDAQKSRGLELEKGNLLKRIKNHIPILIPLIVTAIRRSMEMAEALESRGFGASPKREPMITLKLKVSDYLTVVATILLIILGIYARYFLSLPLIEIPIKIPRILPFLGI
jgi:energy-coupling factor transport system permease protein